jgi:hypothetical protein
VAIMKARLIGRVKKGVGSPRELLLYFQDPSGHLLEIVTKPYEGA